MLALTEDDISRFWSHVRKGSRNDCWLWEGGGDQPYGHFSVGPRATSRTLLAHRVAYELTNGPPNGNVCHHCDTPRCCNPRHLFDGTQQDNRLDCKRKGRTAKGAQHGRAVLTEHLVKKIVSLRTQGHTHRSISSKLCVAETTVGHVLSGRTWSWLTGITPKCTN